MLKIFNNFWVICIAIIIVYYIIKTLFNLNKPLDHDKYLNYIDAIYEGDFFEAESINDIKKKLKDVLSEDDIKKLNSQLHKIKTIYNNRVPDIMDILKMDIHESQKQKLLEKMYHFINSDILSADYNSNLKFLHKKMYHVLHVYRNLQNGRIL